MSRKSQKIYAIIGGGDLSAATSSKHTKVCSVISTFIANFDQYSLRNDLALAKIDCGHQQVIELSEIEPFKSGTDCVIYGYGSLSFETSTQPSNVLYYGAVKPISYDDCESLLGRVTAPSPVSGQFCAQGLPPKYCDACSGKKIINKCKQISLSYHSAFVAALKVTLARVISVKTQQQRHRPEININLWVSRPMEWAAVANIQLASIKVLFTIVNGSKRH